jgi:hypothetical protein
MRRLLAALGLIRPCGTIEITLPKSEDEGCFTTGGPYFIETDKGIEGPFWPALLGTPPDGYLSEPSDTIWTFSDSGHEKWLSMFGVTGDATDQDKNP